MADDGNSVVKDDGAFRVGDLALDVPAVVGAFSQRLHEAGMPVTPSQQPSNMLGVIPKKGKTAPGRSWSDVVDEGYATDR